MMNRRHAIALLVAGIGLAACGGSDDSPEPVPADPVEDAAPADASEPTDAATTDPDGAGDTEATEPDAPDEVQDGEVQMFPDVLEATAEQDGDTWTFSATLSSPYDTPERYADAWRVVGPDGTVYGERILAHDHASEQPFTRSESGIEIPEGIDTVTIEGRDLEFGYGGATFDLTLPR